MPPPQRADAFRHRFYTRRTAEAIMAPSSIVAAGAGTAVGFLAVGLWPIAAVAGAAAYAAAVAVMMPRRRRDGRVDIDPRRLREPWRYYVKEALDARRRFDEAVGNADEGPLRERLESIAERIDDGVTECWRIANRGQELEEALRNIGSIQQLQQRIAELRRGPPSPTNDRLIEALQGQVATYQRIEQTAADARSRIQLMEARLDEAVARAVELRLSTTSDMALEPHLGGLGADVDDIVREMEALRRGLDETAGGRAVM